jgi:hypothetical protein
MSQAQPAMIDYAQALQRMLEQVVPLPSEYC